MWEKLRRQWPRLYEALEWVTFALAAGGVPAGPGGLSVGEGRLTSCAHPI